MLFFSANEADIGFGNIVISHNSSERKKGQSQRDKSISNAGEMM